MKSLRDRLEDVAAAPWLRRTWLLRLLYAIATQFDACIDWAVYGLKARYPSLAPSDALPVLGRERGIRRGFAETLTAYATRLVLWLISRKFKGNAYALMDQLAGYLAGYSVVIRVVNMNGHWWTRNADGTRTHHVEGSSNWLWDGFTTAYSRYWVIVYPPADLWVSRTWGGGQLWGQADCTWGSTATPEQIATLQAITDEWNPPHASCYGTLLALDPSSFGPTGSGTGFPDGTWYAWHKDAAGVAVENRLQTARYCDGSFR